MQFPARFSDLPEYAFPRLRRLLDGDAAGRARARHDHRRAEAPAAATSSRGSIAAHAGEFALYPPNEGTPELRAAIAGWLGAPLRRRRRPGDPADRAQRHPRGPVQRRPRALARGEVRRPAGGPDAEPVLPGLRRRRARGRRRAGAGAGDRRDRLPARLRRACRPPSSTASPSATSARRRTRRAPSPTPAGGAACSRSPSGTTSASSPTNATARSTATPPPPGALEVAAAAGADPERVVVFQSLSKRSNAPGLRSGFAAGGPRAIAALRQLRAYGGAPLPLPLQRAATALWSDEAHVDGEPRALPREVRARRPDPRRHAGLRRRRRRASSSGSASATARRRRCGSGARPASGCCPAATSAAPRRPGRTPAQRLHPRGAGRRRRAGRARARRDPRDARASGTRGKGRVRWQHAARPGAARP